MLVVTVSSEFIQQQIRAQAAEIPEQKFCECAAAAWGQGKKVWAGAEEI